MMAMGIFHVSGFARGPIATLPRRPRPGRQSTRYWLPVMHGSVAHLKSGVRYQVRADGWWKIRE